MTVIDGGEPVSSFNLASAIAQWEDALGCRHVLFTDAICREYSRAALPRSTRPLGVLRPACTPQVQKILRIAARNHVPVYPISRGKNWGYGSACPVTGGQVVVDLSRMDRILEVNDELAYAVLEPGVTQGRMYEHLRERHPGLMLDVTGAGADASIVGNALERGFGHTPYGDRFGHTCGMEVVLADGRVLNTGFSAYENAKAARVYPWGLGPWVDGLFSQSNLGIVTKLGLWLMPRPESIQAFAFTVAEHERLGDIADRLRRLRLADVVRSNVHIANDLRVLSSRMSYPWHLTSETPLPEPIRHALRRGAGLGAWNVMGALYGTKEMVSAARRVVGKEFRDVARVKFFDPRKIKRLAKVAALLNWLNRGHNLRETLASATSVYNLLQGIPVSDFLRGVAWRSKRPVQAPINPTDFGCIWLSPVLPMTNEACREVLALIEPVFGKYRFEPLLTFSSVNERALCCVIQISYDKEDSSERARAGQCYEALFDRLFKNGFMPYRVGVQAMQLLDTESTEFWNLSHQIKESIDPNGVIAPGRYQPNISWPPMRAGL